VAVTAQVRAMPLARLANFDAEHRAAGSFYVILKSDADLSEFEDVIGEATPDSIVGDESKTAASGQIPARAEAVRRMGSQLMGRMHGGRVSGVNVAGAHRAFLVDGASDDEMRSVVALDPRIETVSANIEVRLESVPNPQQQAPWGLSRLSNGALPPEGLNFPNTYLFDNTARGVRIYILDTGVRTTHTEFQGRAGSIVLDCVAGLATMGGCGLAIQQPGNPPQINQVQDCLGHGTHVASAAGGVNYGVAKEVNVAGFIVLGSGNFNQSCDSPGNTGSLIAAVQYIINTERFHWNGPQVINLSVGPRAVDTTYDDTISQAIAAGLIVVTAVPDFRERTVPGFNGIIGEDPCSGSKAVSPVDVPAIIAVGGSAIYRGTTGSSIASNPNAWYDSVGGLSKVWDMGNCVAVFAPGVQIIGATNLNDTDSQLSDGTSFAAPIVSGMAAMYLQTHAHAVQSDVKSALINAALTGQILGCATSNGTTTTNYYLGSSQCPYTAPNRLAHLPLPTGSDNAVGGPTGGPFQDAFRKMWAFILNLLFN